MILSQLPQEAEEARLLGILNANWYGLTRGLSCELSDDDSGLTLDSTK